MYESVNKIASSTVRNFDRGGLFHFKFQYLKNLCPYFKLMRNTVLYLLRFSKKHRKKVYSLIIFKGPLLLSAFYECEFWPVLRN